ncbi:DNA polymerase III subunit alpha [Enterococcus sp. LJL90]
MLPQLNTTTSFTLLQSTLKIKSLVETAKARGYQALAIADHNVLTAAVDFFQACQKNQLQPVIGLRLDYQIPDRDGVFQLVVYAKNIAGYQQLLQLSTYNMTHDKPLFLEEQVENFSELVGILPADNELRTNDRFNEASANRLPFFQELFSDKQFYFAVEVPDLETENAWLAELQAQGLPLIAFPSVRYLNANESFAVKVMQHINDGTILEENLNDGFRDIRGTEFLRNAAEITELYQCLGFAEAVIAAENLVATCQFELPLHQKLLPHYQLPQGETAASYLAKLCQQALTKRVPAEDSRYTERLNYELEIIHSMGFDDYFLIVWDVMAFAHQNKIVTGAGRGSAAGSLVAYLLEITDVDPIQYDLLFERFLNPERYTMPDIDLDIPDNKRDEILQYVQEKYGHFHMAQIATFGTMAAKMVLRDVARVFGLSQSEANRWSQAIPNRLKITLPLALEDSNKLQTLAGQSEKYQLLLETAMQLEGLPRHVSTHAAGVVISDQNLVELVPLQTGSDNILLTQFTMNDVEAIGLLKMDFLGLRNLSIIDDTLKGIKKGYGIEFDYKQIPLDDLPTIELFQKGATSGIFQFESAGIRNVLRRLEPNGIEDIAAVNALYRPGPMQNIDTFIRRKKGQEPIRYPDDSLAEILGNTYGVMVYQEQVMQVASKMAGFSLGQADILRRAISKKKKDVLDEQRHLFVSGAIKQSYSEAKANEVYDYIERFANYGFNRSHAFAYSFVGFQMAYLKVHYPAPFYGALLHSVRHNPAKIKEYVSEARKNGVELIAPSINQSSYSFKIIDQGKILFGLSGLKGLRRDFILEILEERRAAGRYTSFDQFLIRTHNKWLKLENLRPLVAIGVFDEIEPNRKQLMNNLESKIQNTIYSGGSLDLLGIMELKEAELPDYTLTERLNLEEDYLGIYLSGHPTEGFHKLRKAKKIQSITDSLAGQKNRVLYYLRDLREIRTKKGELMAFLEGNDSSGEISVTIFPQLYRRVMGILEVNQVYYIEGKVEESSYNQELQLLAENIQPAIQMEGQIADQTAYLKVIPENDTKEFLQKLQGILQRHSGHIPVIVFFSGSGRKIQLAEAFWVDDSREAAEQLKYLLGNENVVFKNITN